MTQTPIADLLRSRIRTVPDWPEPGVQFRDITPLLQQVDTFQCIVDAFIARYRHSNIDAIAGIDARGFLFGGALAYALKKPLIPIRKADKLPFKTLRQTYHLEYGTATIEIHADAITAGQKVLLIDDLIATGGTLLAAAALVRSLNAIPYEAAAVIDLPDLQGSSKLRDIDVPVFHLCNMNGC